MPMKGLRKKEWDRLYYARNRERILQRGREYRRANPRKRQELRLQTWYGIGVAERDKLLLEQKGICAACQEAPATEVDHCHTTGEIRGMLCGPCNRAAGQVSDSPERLRAIADYLERASYRLVS